MPNRIHGLRIITLSMLVAIAGTTAAVAPVAATDPVPADSPAPTPSLAPTAAPSDSPTPGPVVSPTPLPDPASVAAPAPAAVTAPKAAVRPNTALRVVSIALAKRGAQYRYGGQGPNVFDCSGLVRFSYRTAGVSRKLGGGSSARGMLYWGRLHHLTSRSNPRIGDVVIYGNGTHAAIYIGGGRVIHALNPRLGIRITGLHAVTKPFTTFIHTGLPGGG